MRALRGRRSQVQLARRLGYRGNPITDWERGERFPTIDEALRVARSSGVDVGAAFLRFSPQLPLVSDTSRCAMGAWLSRLRGTTPIIELAQRSGASRFSISRWLKGEAVPRLPDFLRLLDAITGRVPEWVAELTDIEQVPSLRTRYRAAVAAKGLAFEAPWTEAVLRLLETRTYRSVAQARHAYIARVLGITEPEVKACLERLRAAGLVELRGGRYAVRSGGVVDTQGGKEALHALKRHWCNVAAERLRAPGPDDFFAYNVISLSAADLEKVREKLRATFREIRSLVAASQPEEVAALVNLQVVSFTPRDV